MAGITFLVPFIWLWGKGTKKSVKQNAFEKYKHQEEIIGVGERRYRVQFKSIKSFLRWNRENNPSRNRR